MKKLWSILAGLLIAAVFLSACGGAREPVEPIGVREAIDTLEDNLGKKVCVEGYPVAFFLSYNAIGKKVFSVFVSDSAEDYIGEFEDPNVIRDDWIEVVVREKNPLWQSVRDIFDGKRETETYRLLLKGVKSYISGVYYDFVELR